MKTHSILCALVFALSPHAIAGPAYAEEPDSDRTRMIKLFTSRFPQVRLDDYIYGALISNPGGRVQYDQIMEFPPFLGDIEEGRKIWETPFRNGKHFADCFPSGGKNILGTYPYFDEGSGMVITFENAINACLRVNGESEYAYGQRHPMGVVTAYARTLSDGTRLSVRVDSPAALAQYRVGRDLFFQRIGQLNASCAGCHVDNAGNIMRMEVISPALGQATHWPIFRGGEELMTFQGRFKRCMEQMRAEPFGYNSEEWNNLEYYLSYMSNGLPLKSSVFRK
jgi:L-cysteine S-thiosulfotransferase